MAAGRDLLADDAETVKRTTDYLEACVVAASRVGARVVAGPIYSAVGRTWRLDAAARPVSIESFSADNQSIARAASIWRPLEPTQDAIAVDGIAFLRPLFADRAAPSGGAER